MLAANDRVIMITGANRGIGFAVAKTLSDAGFRLSLGARNPEKIDVGAIGGDPLTHYWEATDADASRTWVDQTLNHFGRIDGVVANAGIVFDVDLESGSEQDMDAMLAVNFKGPWRLVRAAMPALKNCGHGRVVNVVSLAGKRLLRESMFGYSASKFAATTLTHAVRQAGWDAGVRATSVCPGMVDTDMVADIDIPAGQFKIDPSTIGATVLYSLNLPNEAVVAEILVNSRLEGMF